MFLRLFHLFFFASLAVCRVSAQTGPEPAEIPAVELSADIVDSLEALESVRKSLTLTEQEIEETRARLSAAPELQKPEIVDRLDTLIERQQALGDDFEAIATGIAPELIGICVFNGFYRGAGPAGFEGVQMDPPESSRFVGLIICDK